MCIRDRYKAKNEVLEREIPQLQEIAGKVWKKEEELKQLKSELAALDRKIQLELAPPISTFLARTVRSFYEKHTSNPRHGKPSRLYLQA